MQKKKILGQLFLKPEPETGVLGCQNCSPWGPLSFETWYDQIGSLIGELEAYKVGFRLHCLHRNQIFPKLLEGVPRTKIRFPNDPASFSNFVGTVFELLPKNR